MLASLAIPVFRWSVIACLFAFVSFFIAKADDSPDGEVRDFALPQLESRLKTMSAGPERDYFTGVLANRAGRIEESIRLLESVLPEMRKTNPARAAVALEALANDYLKVFRYADAARAYDDLLTNFSGQLGKTKLQETQDDAGVAHVLSGAPIETIKMHGQTRLKTDRNPIGSLVTELKVNGVRERWLLDTGANFSVVSKSFAEKLGLKPLPGMAQTMSGLTGIENPMKIAILQELRMGGATIQNVVLLIFDDANLKINLGKESYQINGIVGYPVFQAFGTITFERDGWFEGGETAKRNDAGTTMYMKLLAPVIECRVEGNELPFTLDTGASGTNLSLRYFDLFKGEIKSWKKGENVTGGSGGQVKRTIYLQPEVRLQVGTRTAALKNASIFHEAMGTDLDELYGNLGQDFIAGFQSFTLDFTKMQFSVGAPRSE
jgi:predicted aspartyl protease